MACFCPRVTDEIWVRVLKAKNSLSKMAAPTIQRTNRERVLISESRSCVRRSSSFSLTVVRRMRDADFILGAELVC